MNKNKVHGGDLFNKLNTQLDIVSDTMQNNIDKTIHNMEDIDLLSLNSMEMKDNSEQFNKKAKKARRKMYWKNKRIIGIIGGVVGIVIWVILI